MFTLILQHWFCFKFTILFGHRANTANTDAAVVGLGHGHVIFFEFFPVIDSDQALKRFREKLRKKLFLDCVFCCWCFHFHFFYFLLSLTSSFLWTERDFTAWYLFRETFFTAVSFDTKQLPTKSTRKEGEKERNYVLFGRRRCTVALGATYELNGTLKRRKTNFWLSKREYSSVWRRIGSYVCKHHHPLDEWYRFTWTLLHLYVGKALHTERPSTSWMRICVCIHTLCSLYTISTSHLYRL